MKTKDRADTSAEASQRTASAEQLDSDVAAVFDSLEQLREAQASEAAAPAAETENKSNLEAVLTHYKDWLNTLDR